MRFVSVACIAAILLGGCDDSPTGSDAGNADEVALVGTWHRIHTGPALALSSEVLQFDDSTALYVMVPELPCHEDPRDPLRCYDSLKIRFSAWHSIGDSLLLGNGTKGLDGTVVEVGLSDTMTFALRSDSLTLCGWFGTSSDSALLIRR